MMINNILQKLAFTLTLIMLFSGVVFAQISAIYAGGNVYHGREYSIEELRGSGFNTVIVWTIHIDGDGNLNFNGEFPLVTDGVFIGDDTYPEFRNDLKRLKEEGSSINRIEFGLSAWQSATYDNVKALYESEGVGEGSKLYNNFNALIDAIPEIDAFNNDDEGTYDVESAVAFHTMLYELGVITAGVPYTRAESFWLPFTEQMNTANPGSVDLMYLQVYAGGAGNNPCDMQWQNLGVPIIPGLWGEGSSDGTETPEEVETRMTGWANECGITGGFMWLYADFDQSDQPVAFASAINSSFLIGSNISDEASEPYPVDEATETDIDLDLSWTQGEDYVINTVYFGTTPDLTNEDSVYAGRDPSFYPGTLANNSTYYWRVDQTNSLGSTTGVTWSFTTEEITDLPAKVTVASPADGDNNVSLNPTLSWEKTDGAFTYHLYIGVADELEKLDETRDLYYRIEDLEENRKYYWRLDVENSAGITTGDVWGFETRGIALTGDAEIAVSSQDPDAKWHGVNLIDGEYLNDDNGEWASDGETTPYAELNWEHPQKIGLIRIYGRTDEAINVLSGTFTFSDGSTISVGALPVDGSLVEMEFEMKEVNSVNFQIDESEGDNLGLAEIEVFEFSNSSSLPDKARGFVPANEAIEEDGQVTLRWLRGSFAKSHDVYFSDDETINEDDFFLNKAGEFHVFSDLEPGTYYWRIDEVNENGTIEGDVLSFTVGNTVLSNLNEDGKVKLYPNPTSDKVTLVLQSGFIAPVILKIHDLSGKLIYSEEHTKEYMDYGTISLDLKALISQPGLYFIDVISAAKELNFKLILK